MFSFTLLERPEKFTIEAEPFGCSIKLSWKPPPSRGCPITRYSVHYKESVMSADAMLSTWQRKHLNITDRHHLWLVCDKRYNIIVLAWNERGHSVFDTDSVVSVWTEIGMKLYKNQSHAVKRWIIYFSIHLFQLKLLPWTKFHSLHCTMVNPFVAGSLVLFTFIEIMEIICEKALKRAFTSNGCQNSWAWASWMISFSKFHSKKLQASFFNNIKWIGFYRLIKLRFCMGQQNAGYFNKANQRYSFLFSFKKNYLKNR